MANFYRVTGIKANDKTKAKRTLLSFFVNETEAAEIEAKLVANGYKVTRRPEGLLE